MKARAWVTDGISGVWVAGAQLLAVLSAVDAPTIKERWYKLAAWDTDWYVSIAHQGYHSVWPPVAQSFDQSNVAFFPAYPLSIRLMYFFPGVTPRIAALVAAHLALVGFWTLLLRAWRRQAVPFRAQLAGLLLLLSFPSAFYMAAAYSEPIFCLAMVGFLLLESRWARAGFA